MTALAARFALPRPPRPLPQALGRAVLAGLAWGVPVAVALSALVAWRCGDICLADLAANTALCVAAGTLTLGPLAAFGRRTA